MTAMNTEVSHPLSQNKGQKEIKWGWTEVRDFLGANGTAILPHTEPLA